MALPIFFMATYDPGAPEIQLDEDNSRHIVQVLRMGPGEELQLTDGKGAVVVAAIAEANKKKCRVTVRSAVVHPPPERRVSIAISPLKNASRFEWFLEKATEIGVSEIIPLMSERTERQHLRQERLQNILVSAMLQSRQAWLPVLRPPTAFRDVLGGLSFDRRLIAWLGDQPSAEYPKPDACSTLVLIGPEGDFTPEETASAIGRRFVQVTLGNNRLRTETAGVVAATLLCIG
ncbi:MAG TPA: RsmE family RNA methyltransferase [Puia sp.]|jgi:16S rRNA (uracil1498-N3)-methyltransferase|nr:RsmE family RNA methyltransferase [Puia sp.]